MKALLIQFKTLLLTLVLIFITITSFPPSECKSHFIVLILRRLIDLIGWNEWNTVAFAKIFAQIIPRPSIGFFVCVCMWIKMVSIKEFSYVSYRFQEQLFEIASFIDQITDYIQFSVYGINQTTKMYLRTIIMLWFVESTTESRNWIPIWLTTRSTREYSIIRK